jgi:hypothetical protein
MLYIVKLALFGAIAVVWSVAGMGIFTPFYWLSLLLLLGVDNLSAEIAKKEKGKNE